MFLRLRSAKRRRLPPNYPLWRHAIARCALVCIGLVAIQNSPIGDQLEIQFSHKLLFRTRNLLGGPSVDPRIKVFAFDDGTASAIGALDLNLDDWATVLQALAKQAPKAILFDKIFDKPYPAADVRRFTAALTKLSVPVIADSFIAGIKIPFRAELPPSAAHRSTDFSSEPIEALSWLPEHGGYHYGAPPEMGAVFRGVGHAVYDNDGYVIPLHRLENSFFVPHWALIAADSMRLTRNGVFVNDKKLSLDERGRTLVNIAARKTYSSRVYSMLPLITRARAGKSIPVVEADDYVVLLPAMYTGNTDWKETPQGIMPGGYIMIALLNSVITGKWLVQLGNGSIAIVALTLLGMLFGARLPSILFWPALSGMLVIISGSVLAAFIGFDIVVPLLLPVGGLVLGSISVFVKLENIARREQARIEREIDTARLVQKSFIPSQKIVGERISIDGYSMPASECGGDFWRHFSVAPGLDYLIIGDATGHGLPAALVTAMAYSACATVETLLRHEPLLEHSPARLLEVMNEVLHSTHDIEATMTCFVALFDLRSGVVRYANSGHPFPLLVRGAQDAPGARVNPYFSLLATGDVLGFSSSQCFKEKENTILPGDKVVFYSDGLIENRNLKGQAWGKRSLQQTIARNCHGNMTELKDQLVETSRRFYATANLEDDVTVVVVEILPEGKLSVGAA